MIRWPRLLGGSHKLVSWLNRLLDSCRAAEVKEVKNGQLVRTTDGLTIICGGVGGGRAGWDWASPKKYDKSKSYAEGSVVIIMPTDAIVTTGAVSASYGSEGDTVQAQAGIWVAMQSVAPEDQGGGTFWYHVPHWPLPDEADIDSEQNFWIQITAFCETT
jgi:hypothetical protein